MTAHARPVRVLVAPDSFKGGLSAREVIGHLSDGLYAEEPSLRLVGRPLADGGEGTIDALATIGATIHEAVVAGPLGSPVSANWAVRGDVGYVEAAQAAGHALVPRRDGATALAASTLGVGELMRAALDDGVRRLVLTTGDCAATDGGAGMLRSLGVRIIGADGLPSPPGGGGLSDVHRIDLSQRDHRLAGTPLVVATDVDNPLLGPHGSAAVFGPQKGAGPGEVRRLADGLRHWVAVLGGEDVAMWPGAGASGGVGFAAMAVLGATRAAGADMVLDLLELDAALASADLVITGEGRFDHQTVRGKAPGVLIRRARRRGVPVALVCGEIAFSAAELASMGVDAAWSLTDLVGSDRMAIDRAGDLIRHCGSKVIRWWRAGYGAS